MENGSLLQEALAWAQKQHECPSSSPFLLMQLFYLPPPTNDPLSLGTWAGPSYESPSIVKQLIQIGNHLNTEFQKLDYPWIMGGDGPVWGFDIVEDDSADDNNFDPRDEPSKPQPSIHRTKNLKQSKIPCLTCTVRYGDSVQDEWYAIRTVLELSKHMNSRTVIRCIDSEDGQILWIELADLLPDWVDELHQGFSGKHSNRVNKNDSEFRCWIRQGQIVLLPPNPDAAASDTDYLAKLCEEPLSLSSSLQRLQINHNLVDLASTSYIEQVLRSKVPPLEEMYHRAAVLLPRRVARLFEKRPDLVNLSVSKWMQMIIHNNTGMDEDQGVGSCGLANTTSIVADQLFWNDLWVWSTLKFGRTPYAMLRNATSRRPGWEYPDQIPPQYQNRIPTILTTSDTKTTSSSSLSLYPFALPMGIRLVVGLEAAAVCQPQQPSATTQDCQKHLWKQILSELQMNDPFIEEQYWQFPIWHEISKNGNPTPLSYPNSTLAEQIMTTLNESNLRDENRTDERSQVDFESSTPPSADEVDNDHWMYMDGPPDTTAQPPVNDAQKHVNTQVLDHMVQGVQIFLSGESSLLEGVVTSSKKTADDSIVINPTIFLNLLHATLRTETSEELQSLFESTKDPFFSSTDYNFLDPNRDDSEEDEGEEAETELRHVMDAMDEEIQRDITTHSNSAELQSHLLSNWLRSLEGGGTGPARNILQELGVIAPNILAEEEDGEEDNDDEIES